MFSSLLEERFLEQLLNTRQQLLSNLTLTESKDAIVYIRIEMQLSYGVYVSSSFPINQTFWGQTSTSLIINKTFSVSSYDVFRIIACTCGVEVMCFPHRDGTSFPEKLN